MASPFQIRNRVKAMLGLGGAPKAPKPEKPKIKMVVVGPGDREQTSDGPVGQTVLLCAGNLGAPIASGCSDSSCSTCRIEVLEGDDVLGPQSAHELSTLKANQRPEHLRLACLATVTQVGGGVLRVRAHEFLE